MMMLAWLITSLYIKSFECKTCPICKPETKIREALVHFPPLPLQMFRFDFKVTWLKQHCKKGGKTTWSKKYKCLKVFEWVYGIKIHVLGKELFCTQLFAIAAKFPNLVYSERCSHNLSGEQYHLFAFFMPSLAVKWRKPKTWPYVCLPISWW